MNDQSSKRNKHGLTRHIRKPIKREIRQQCGFGCVVCGSAIYQYEHVDPPFADAKAHEPDKIALLCGKCHDCVTKGLWSKATIKAKRQAPKCLEDGFSFGAFDLGEMWPEVMLGQTHCQETRTILAVYGEKLLDIEPPEASGAPFRLSATFYGETGDLIFTIVQNEWQGPTTNWDIEQSGPRITIRSEPGRIALQIRAEPPGKLVVEKINMLYQGVRILGEENGVNVVLPSGREVLLQQCRIGPAEWGIRVEKSVLRYGTVGNGANGVMNISLEGPSLVFKNLSFGHNTISAPFPNDQKE